MEGKLFFGQYFIWVILLLGQLPGNKSCILKERNALLELKQDLISRGALSFLFPTWTNDTKSDCCQWRRVECNRTSGRVTGIFISEIGFTKRPLLNLSLLHPFEEVRNLSLSNSGFIGLFDDVEGDQSLKRLRNLEILDLSSNIFNNSIFPFLNAATSITTLFLQSNYMDGPFPAKGLKDLTNLELLNLRGSRLNGSIPVRELSSLRNLKVMGLSGNEFSGSMDLQEICKLNDLQELDLSKNKLVGEFPLCLTGLTGLRVLDLSSNQLTGMVPSDLGKLESLEYLSLFDNNFEGFFSVGSLSNLSELKVLKIGSNSNLLGVKFESYSKPKFQLSVIVLRSCNLEKVPHFLLSQKDLRQVDLSENKITGKFPSWLLENNTKLEVLLLQSNSLSSFQLPKSAHNLLFLNVSLNEFKDPVPENIGWILPHLQFMNLANNGFLGNLPSSLGNMKSIEFLDISHNTFQGELPTSFVKGCHFLQILKLSHNKLSGEVFPRTFNFTRMYVLSMDNNQFTGKIGQGLRSLRSLSLLDISNNNLTGAIPSWIGELSSLYALLLSNNSLEGTIPISLFSLSSLFVLDLSANILSGDMPPNVSFTAEGVVLLLQDNNLSGAVPATFLTNVSILDLRNNSLSGNIPEFINAKRISILLLRGNNFTGRIPHQLCGLSNIQLLDLADNRLNGSLPSCLSNTSFGLGHASNYNYDSSITSTTSFDIYFESLLVVDRFTKEYDAGTRTKIEFVTKHRYDGYMGGNLKLFFGLDFSRNVLTGEIPVEFGDFMELRALNLSHNKLSGVIPESFSGLKNVESLDLSFNRLQGRIPQKLAELSSLAVFNVSFNNLSGVIPQGKQFNTFDAQSFLGNPLLCGQQTNTSCNSSYFLGPDTGVQDDESQIDMVSFYWSFTATYVTVLVGILASLSFDSPWRRFWFYIVDVFINKARNLLW